MLMYKYIDEMKRNKFKNRSKIYINTDGCKPVIVNSAR